MTPLLSRLLSLSRAGRAQDEDFLSEVLAAVLQARPEVLLPELAGRRFSVSTQVSFARLEGHETASRPDLYLLSVDDEAESDDAEPGAPMGPEVAVMVECKLGSGEGYKQLSRYADHLRRWVFEDPGATRQAYLVYLTQYADPKEPPESCSDRIAFRPLRWYQIHRVAKAALIQAGADDFLLTEFVRLMEYQDLDQSRRFSSEDMVALPRLRSLMKLMGETLKGNVRTVMEQTFGNKPSQPDGIFMGQLERHDRYIIWSGGLGNMSGLAGFDFSTRPFPSAVVQVEYHGEAHPSIRPLLMSYAELSYAERGTVKSPHGAWVPLRLDHKPKFCAVSIRRGLEHFLAHDDHVAALEAFFVEELQRVQRFRNGEGASLPWL